MNSQLFNSNRLASKVGLALLVALLSSASAARGGSLAGDGRRAVDSLQAGSARINDLTQTIFANIQAGWSKLAATERDGGHLMVLALNEVRKCRRKLVHEAQVKAWEENPDMLRDGPEETEEDIERTNQVSPKEETQIEMTYEKFGEMARASVKDVAASPSVPADREERKRQAMEAIKRRTIDLVKSVFMEEMAGLAQALLLVWTGGAGAGSAPSNVNVLGKLLGNLQSKLLKYLVGIFVDLIPFILGQKQGDVNLSFETQILRDDLSDFFHDDEEQSLVTTTENPGAAMLNSMWFD